MRAAVVTVSTSVANAGAKDVSGPRLVELCEAAGLETVHEVVSDDCAALSALLSRLADEDRMRFVFTTGGTGMTGDDVTPEATRDVVERDAPGYAEAIRVESRRHTPLGILTRGCRDPRSDADRQPAWLAQGRGAVVAGDRAHPAHAARTLESDRGSRASHGGH